MIAMLMDAPRTPLRKADVAMPEPGKGQIRVRVQACAVCRTDLHVIDGDLARPKLPLVLGHEIAGIVDVRGPGAERFPLGARVGIPWLGWTDGSCRYCRSGRENLCDHARFTGYHIDGGYAEYAVADERYSFPLPDGFDDVHAAPLMCAGVIGYRALRFAGDARNLGVYGFGAAAHIVTQVAVHQGRNVFAFVRPGDNEGMRFARELGAAWAGDSQTQPPERLDAALIFAPVGSLVPVALGAVEKGGVVVCAGIHMSDIPSFSYDLLWGERVVRSVANLARGDAQEFLSVVCKAGVRTSPHVFPLEYANEAIGALRAGSLRGAAVLVPGRS